MGFGVVVHLFRCLFIILRRTSLIEELIRKERKVMEGVTLAAEASNNLQNVESPLAPLVRGHSVRRRLS